MRSRKRSSPAVEHPIDTPSLAFNHMNYTVEDFIDFKESVRRPWRKGRVKELGHHCLIIEPDAGGALVTIYPGKCGRVRQRHGGAAAQLPAELDPEGQAQARARLRIDGVFVVGELPPVRPVRRDGSPLRGIPKPAPPARSPEYLAYVRSHPCCSCPEEGASNPAEVPSQAHHQGRRGVGQKCSDFRCVPLCGLCHLDYTDNGTLPGRDRAAALALMQATQVELLACWAEREARAAAAFVPVPILRLVAACLALVFCLEMTACAVASVPGLDAGSRRVQAHQLGRRSLAPQVKQQDRACGQEQLAHEPLLVVVEASQSKAPNDDQSDDGEDEAERLRPVLRLQLHGEPLFFVSKLPLSERLVHLDLIPLQVDELRGDLRLQPLQSTCIECFHHLAQERGGHVKSQLFQLPHVTLPDGACSGGVLEGGAAVRGCGLWTTSYPLRAVLSSIDASAGEVAHV